jgi:carboxypeptidase family protein
MAFFPRTLATLAFLVICSTAAAESGPGVVRGEVIDDSGGVLPGVTVVATAADGRILATAVTDGKGGYVLKALPLGPVHLTFQLAGFDNATVGLTVQPGVEVRVVERLGLAAITESVVVYGKAPVAPPRPLLPLDRQRPLLPPSPHRVVIPVPTHDRDSICGPAKPGATAESLGTIRLRRYKAERGLYATGDELVIDGGTLNGLDVGRNLVVRRYYRVSGLAGASATGEHSSGLLQIVTADERSSIAIVVYACDELMKGDFLASFTPEPIRTPDPVGIPAFGAAARILFADAGQTLGVPRRLMVIDQGSEDRIRVGQRLTLFRRRGWDAAKPDVVGDAIVVAVRTNSATIRVERVNDAISSGDWAAPQSQ